MTDDLDNLRPEVREAINRQDRQKKCDEYCPVCEDRATVRAELLRLEGECGRLDRAWQCAVNQALENGQRAKRAEAELAALKARIAEAPITQVTRMEAIGGGGYEWAGCRVPDAWNGKRVRLVVEE